MIKKIIINPINPHYFTHA